MTASPSAAPAPLPAPGFAVTAATRQRALRPALLGVTLVHAALLGMLVSAADEAEPPVPPRPLTVSLIVPEPERPELQPAPRPTPPERPPEPQPPKPKQETPAPPRLAAEPTPALPAEPVVEAPAPRSEPPPPVAPPSPPAPVAQATPPPAPTPAHPADYRTNPKPPYPRLSRRLGEEGTVRLNILVNPDGSVARLELAESSGHPRLDRSAMETVQSSWKFEPARQGGSPVAAWVIVPIQFTLRS